MASAKSATDATGASSVSTTPLTPTEEHARLRSMVEFLMARLEATTEENNILQGLLAHSEAETAYEKRCKECQLADNIKLSEKNDEQVLKIFSLEKQIRKGN